MTKVEIQAYLESDKKDYILVHKRAVATNGIALAISINQISVLTKTNPKILLDVIQAAASIEAEKLTLTELEEFIQDSINTIKTQDNQ